MALNKLQLSVFQTLQLILLLVSVCQFSNAVEENFHGLPSSSIPRLEESTLNRWFDAFVQYRPDTLLHLFNKKLITNADIPNSMGYSVLCLIATSCGNPDFDPRIAETFTTLLDLGADPDQICSTPAFKLPIVFLLARNRCQHVLSKFVHHKAVNETILNGRLTVNAPRPPTTRFLPVVHFASIPSLSNMQRDSSGFGTLDVLLSHPKLDINQRSSTGVSAVKSWCLVYVPSWPLFSKLDSILKKFWLRPDLDDEQRELILNHCGYNRAEEDSLPAAFRPMNSRSRRNPIQSRSNIWKVTLRNDIEFGSKQFFQHHLNQVYISSKQPNVVNRPMKVMGLISPDYGGVVASFLEDLSAVVFSFGGHQVTSLSNGEISEHVRISVTDTRNQLDELEKVFAPAPSSLLLFKDDVSDPAGVGAKLKEQLRTAGVLVGTCLNTLFSSKTLSLGVPLDRIVLQRLIDPTSAIERSDVLDSAVFIKALQMMDWGFSLSEAQEQFPTSWPVISFDQSSAMSAQAQNAKIRKEWEDYSVALLDQLLSEAHSPAFASMLSGFRATIPQGQKSHLFNAALAHRMLVGERRVTIDMLQSRLKFSSSRRVNVENETMFVNVLRDLCDEDPKNLKRFLKEVTGSSRLRISSMSPPITIQWIKQTRDIQVEYYVSTCTSTLSLLPTSDEQMMRTILQGVMISSSRKYAFNTF